MRAVLSLLLLLSLTVSAAPKLIAGEGKANRARMIFVAEGYTSSQESKFNSDVQAVYRFLIREQFYDIYKGAFNFYSSFTASQQSGADDPATGTTVNTAFDASFGANGIDRLLVVSNSKVNTFLKNEYANYDPSLDIVLVVVNSDKYGGSGGQIATTSTNAQGPEIALHEIGHSYAGLGDEYETPYPGWTYRQYPNATQQTSRNQIPWSPYIDAQTPLPTPTTSTYANAIGLYQGAQYSMEWYRPHQSCMMRYLGYPFCSVCTEAHITNLYRQVSPVDSVYPSTSTTLLLTDEASHKSVEVFALPLEQEVQIVWTVAGREVGSGVVLNLQKQLKELENGSYQLQAELVDGSGLYRLAETVKLARQTVEWNLVVDRTASEVDDEEIDDDDSSSLLVSQNRRGGMMVHQEGALLLVELPDAGRRVELLFLQGKMARRWNGVPQQAALSVEGIPAGWYLLRSGREQQKLLLWGLQ